MTNIEAENCMTAFKAICEKADKSELVSSEDCQYWVFERGYTAAMQEVAKVITLRQLGRSTELKSQMAANKSAYQ